MTLGMIHGLNRPFRLHIAGIAVRVGIGRRPARRHLHYLVRQVFLNFFSSIIRQEKLKIHVKSFYRLEINGTELDTELNNQISPMRT